MVVPDLSVNGGVSTVADFIYQTIVGADQHAVDLISLATSASDEASVRITHPDTWMQGIQTSHGEWIGRPYQHFGAIGTELECSHYMPRKELTQLLNSYDLIQVVAGSPAWAMVCRDVKVPVCLQVATMASVERQSMLREGRGAAHLWRSAMTKVTSRLDSKALHVPGRVFVENQWMYDLVSHEIGENRVVYAPPGVDMSVFHPKLEAEPTTDKYILSVSRLSDPRKNVPLMIEAYAQLRRGIPDPPRLLLAGKSAPSDAAWSLADSLGVRESIEFKEGLGLQELAEVYRKAQFFVLSSDEEGFGMVILESMASGVPVISTRSGGPEGIITDGQDGLLVPLRDPGAMAAAMERLVTCSEERKAMGLAARNTVNTRFSFKAAGTIFLDTYGDMLTGD